MSILIKGVTMPKNCKQCFYRASGCRSNKHNNGRPQDCPLIPVPPHGRLIDAAELIEHAWRDKLDSRELIAGMIDSAPTIIPADVPENNVGNIPAEEGET